jgi:hypothetical protein
MTHGNHGQLILTSTPNIAITNLELTNTGDNTTFKIGSSDQAKRYWDRTATFTFQKSTDGSSWTSATAVDIRHVGGYVTLSAAVGGTHQARIQSGAYLPWSAIGDIKGWSLDVSREKHDATTLTTNSTPTRAKTYSMGLLDSSIKIEKFLVDAAYLGLLTIYSNDTLVASLVADVTQTIPPRFECYAKLEKDGMKVALNELEMEDLDFVADSFPYLVNS